MVKIRLRRIGAKKKPSYRLVIADSRTSRDGAFIEIIGHYNPLTDPETIVINGEKAQSWLDKGAQPTATAARLLLKVGISQKPKLAKAGVAKKPEPAKAAVTQEAVAEEAKPAKAGVAKKPKPAKAGVAKKPKTTKPAKASAKEKTKPATKKSKTTKEKP